MTACPLVFPFPHIVVSFKTQRTLSLPSSSLVYHLSKVWKAKFIILCNVIFLLRLQGKFRIDHFAFGVKGLNRDVDANLLLLPSHLDNINSHKLMYRSYCFEYSNAWSSLELGKRLQHNVCDDADIALVHWAGFPLTILVIVCKVHEQEFQQERWRKWWELWKELQGKSFLLFSGLFCVEGLFLLATNCLVYLVELHLLLWVCSICSGWSRLVPMLMPHNAPCTSEQSPLMPRRCFRYALCFGRGQCTDPQSMDYLNGLKIIL